jgi:formylglycine-generating enzyme required for sulfatase activity
VDGDAGDASVDGDAGDASVDGDAGDASVDGDAGDASVDGDAGDAGVDGDASVDGDAYDSGACGVCTALEVCGPNGLCLAAQKELGPGRSIDVTEVTRSQYGAWLATSPSTAAQPSYCTFNTAFTPSCYLPLDDTDANLPMVCIDWCDARAYCLGVGKRLCGHPSPAATPYASFADPSQSVWYEACTSSGVHPYPYGDAYQPAACNGPEAGQGALVEVAHFNQCQPLSAPYAGVFDLSGNAVEHEDSCETTIHGALDLCRVRGGSHVSPPGDLRCDFSWSVQRSWSSERLGFRCCSVP